MEYVLTIMCKFRYLFFAPLKSLREFWDLKLGMHMGPSILNIGSTYARLHEPPILVRQAKKLVFNSPNTTLCVW